MNLHIHFFCWINLDDDCEHGITDRQQHLDKYSALSHAGLGVIAHGFLEVFPQY